MKHKRDYNQIKLCKVPRQQKQCPLPPSPPPQSPLPAPEPPRDSPEDSWLAPGLRSTQTGTRLQTSVSSSSSTRAPSFTSSPTGTEGSEAIASGRHTRSSGSPQGPMVLVVSVTLRPMKKKLAWVRTATQERRGQGKGKAGQQNVLPSAQPLSGLSQLSDSSTPTPGHCISSFEFISPTSASHQGGN